MKKRLNIVFFSICFLAALLAEAYCIHILDGDLLSVGGIGIVVLISGYLLLDSIREQWVKSREKAKFVLEKIHQEETEKWNERYNELSNLQKATYTATKKNTAMLQEKFDEILIKMDSLEKIYEKSAQKITELQKKSMEGQKNALNLEINYNKENTKQIIKVLREQGKKLDQEEQLSLISNQLEKNNAYLQENIGKIQYEYSNEGTSSESGTDSDTFEFNTFEDEDKSDLETVWNTSNDQELEENNQQEKPTIVPLYDDPNKALTPDEIASLFTNFGK